MQTTVYRSSAFRLQPAASASPEDTGGCLADLATGSGTKRRPWATGPCTTYEARLAMAEVRAAGGDPGLLRALAQEARAAGFGGIALRASIPR